MSGGAPTPVDPSPLAPAGSEAHRLAGVWWLILGLGTFVAVFVLALVVVGLLRRRGDPDPDGPEDEDHPRDQRFVTLGGLVLPVVVLTVAAVATVTTSRALRRPDRREVPVEVVGQQWFWRVRYPGTGVATANELRLPVDRPVDVRLRSVDVIHSFWVPRLAGKVDLIPGQTNHLRFTPTKVGSYRGECAEFCGLQHAHMAFVVVVMPSEAFDRWIRRHDGEPARPATASEAGRGREVFAGASCAGCHTVRGLTTGTQGPDLTLLATRSTIASGTLPNDPVALRAWIRDPDASKPGAKMPPTPEALLTDDQLDELVAYLGTLR